MSCRFAFWTAVVGATAFFLSGGGPGVGSSGSDGGDLAGSGRVRARGTYLVVYAEHLAGAAREWADYRAACGWHVFRYPVRQTEDVATRRRALQAHIRRLAREHRSRGRLAVLLLGDANEQGIPTWTFPQPDPTLRSTRDPHYATDHPYQLLGDPDGRPEVLLGRVPANTPEQARAVLAKIKRYERGETPGPWRRRIAYAAGEGRFGVADHLLEGLFQDMVDRLVPDDFDVSLTYAKASSIYCPPPSRLTDTVLEQLGDGALLFNYVGHGDASGLDHLQWNGRRLPILDVSDVERLSGEHSRLPIALLTCCSAGWYDLPEGGESLGEAMLFHPAGPVAVIAGSRPTHPYANVILQKDITKLLLIDRAQTAGELDLLAMRSMLEIDESDLELDVLAAPIAVASDWPSGLRELRRMHVRLYNLLGDPALRIALPRRQIVDFALDGDRVTGRIDGMSGGKVVITVETDRTAPAGAEALVPVAGADDPDLEAKAAVNYAIANNRVLSRLEGEVTGGRFEIVVTGRITPPAALVKAYAHGDDRTGRPVDAIGALRLGSESSPPKKR
ncbi:MAG: C25 family cysteine peptidase [Planctomycetota bacterium]|jgi:hypothetical protein